MNTDTAALIDKPSPGGVVDGTDLGSGPKKRRAARVWHSARLLSVLSITAYLVGWFLLTKDGFDVIGTLKFPTPKMVAVAAWDDKSLLANDVAVSWLRMITGWTVGVLFGVTVGLLMYESKKLNYLISPMIEGMRPVPAIAMVPFFILWFGLAETGKFILIVGGVFTILVVSTLEAARNLDRTYVLAAQSLGASRTYILRRIVVPGIVPSLIGPLRVSAALSFTLVVAAEYIGAQSGLGYRIIYAEQLFETQLILLGVTLFGLMSGITDLAIRKLAGHITRWSERQE